MPASLLSSQSTASGPIRVLVVDDSALMRSLMAAMIGRQPDMTCLGGACDAHQARETWPRRSRRLCLDRDHHATSTDTADCS